MTYATAYLLARLVLDNGEWRFAGYHIYSEREPTQAIGRELYALVRSAHRPTYAQAEENLLRYLRDHHPSIADQLEGRS